jgi:uncharacterized protein (UPF0332 family)
MGERLSLEMRRLLEERRLVRSRIRRGMILEELKGARYDLERSCKSLKDKDYKWATVQAYYSMFHATRALIYSRGFREKSHRALLTALRELFVRNGQLDREYYDDLRNAMDLREEADYGMVFSEEGAIEVVEKAKKFLDKSETILQDYQ